MYTILLEDFLNFFPEFDTEEANHRSIALELESNRCKLSQQRWGEFWQNGVYLLTAHNISLYNAARAKGAAAGASSSFPLAAKTQSAGGVTLSETYALPSGENACAAFLSSTIYGQQYLQLAKLMGAGATVA